MPKHQPYPTLAAIDLGSNSFHLQIGRIDGEQLFYLDAHKEAVRLAGGLNAAKELDEPAQERAIACLARFGERIKGMPAGAVRAVGTSALRVAKNAPVFLDRARDALGFGIDIVSGREEARLIYLGVSHSLPHSGEPQLVIDIGGGSTECILGTGYEAHDRESLRLGCVLFSERYFSGGKVGKAAMKAAMTTARIETQAVAHQFNSNLWRRAIGSSGSARSLGDILLQNGQSDGTITAGGLKWLRERLIKAGDMNRLEMPGLKPDRRPVLAGGTAIMSGLFQELGIEEMNVAQGAMREGILWDLLGRVLNHDIRDLTVDLFVRRYHVDVAQAQRVERLAMRLFMQISDGDADSDGEQVQQLIWAARLHEIGISIAHSGFHKHGAYILANADMPGFARRDQCELAKLVRASRGGLEKLGLAAGDELWPLILCLRLAVLFSLSRRDLEITGLALENVGNGDCRLSLPHGWLSANPLTRAALEDELKAWRAILPILRLTEIKVNKP